MFSAKNARAWSGRIAVSTKGSRRIWEIPSTASVANQTSMTGREDRADAAGSGPLDQEETDQDRDRVGITRVEERCVRSDTFHAERTEMAGVMMPSP